MGRRHMACYQHTMVRAAVAGWFVCQSCGLPAVCPGCVGLVPEGAWLHLCMHHQQLADVGVGRGVVWATVDSSR